MRKVTGTAIVLGLWAFTSLAHAQTPATADTPAGPTVTVVAERPVKGAWFRAESQHFIVYSDTRHADVQDLLDQLERFRFVLRSVSGLDDTAVEPKLTLYYLYDESELKAVNPAVPDRAIELYESCEDGVEGFAVHKAYTLKNNVAVEMQAENTGLTYIFQAYARHFFYAHFPQRLPRWYIDGYAQYFSTVRFDGNDAIVGLPPEALGSYMTAIDNENLPARIDYKDVLNDDAAYRPDAVARTNAQASEAAALGSDASHPAKSFFTNVDPQHADDRAQVQAETEFEARAWLLTHWVLSSAKTLNALPGYVAALGQGDNRLNAFHQAFGRSAAEMDQVLHVYLHHGARLLRTRFAALPQADVIFENLDSADSPFVLDKAALKGCPSKPFGEALLARVRGEAAKAPDDADAQLTLSRAEIGYGDPVAALPWLTQETQDDLADFDAEHLLGRAELLKAKMASGDDRTQAFSTANLAFTRAAKIDPQSAVNAFWYYRAQVASAGKVEPDAAGAAVLAARLAPEVDAYAFNAGLVYARAGDGQDAFTALHSVADNPNPSAWAKPARDWISRLKTGVSADDAAAAILAADPPAPGANWAGQTQWTYANAAVLGDATVQKDEQDFLNALRGLEELKNGTQQAPPQFGVRMPADDE